MLDISTLILLATIFLGISYISASVGLGGGSCYTAIMAALGLPPLSIPLISLSLNLVVTSAASYQFIRHHHASWKLITPFLVTSLPMAYLGGSLQLPKRWFYAILLASLVLVVVRIFFLRSVKVRWNITGTKKLIVSMIAGTALGFIAGVVGIGGGIYLVPLIIILGLGNEKQAASSGAIFIWLNSLTGMISRLQHHDVEILNYLTLIVAVFLGGMAGGIIGATSLKPQMMQKILGIIIIVAVILLIPRLL